MKNSLEIISQPIISISEGNQIGNVKSIVINPEKGSVDFLTIEHEDWQVSVKAIPFKKVIGIGEYAITVENDNAVIDLNEIPIANTLVNKKIKITNTKVMTRKGQLLGEISEYYIDEENGNIIAMQLGVGGKDIILKAEAVLTFGKDILVVVENASDYYIENIEDLEESLAEESIEQSIEATEPVLAVEETTVEQTVEQVSDVVAEAEAEAVVSLYQQLSESEKALKDKQIELLQGKAVSKDILNGQGELLFAKGTILTVTDIETAQSEGPSVVVELSMNVIS
jgi:uncharacterized protein YrrD